MTIWGADETRARELTEPGIISGIFSFKIEAPYLTIKEVLLWFIAIMYSLLFNLEQWRAGIRSSSLTVHHL